MANAMRRMRRERQRRGWSAAYVGAQVGITRIAVLNLEKGLRQPSYKTVVRLEDLFGMGHRELMAPDDDIPAE